MNICLILSANSYVNYLIDCEMFSTNVLFETSFSFSMGYIFSCQSLILTIHTPIHRALVWHKQ